MKAGQLIYTSWKNGNSSKKGFMVYSKSNEIVDSEVDEILEVMKYDAPTDLPATPDRETISTLFPKNFSFFRLSDGKYCIAQSSYVGQDYSGRWGNYLIHALVLDSEPDFSPVSLAYSPIFRTELSEAELNADAAPICLDYVDVSGREVETNSLLNSIIGNQQKESVLAKVLAVIVGKDASTSYVNFIVEPDACVTWIKIITQLLPKKIRNRFFFSTYMSQSNSLVPFVCLRSEDCLSGQSFASNIITVNSSESTYDSFDGVYVGRILSLIRSDLSSCYNYIALVDKMMNELASDDCEAIAIALNAAQGNLDQIKTEDEMLSVISLLSSTSMGTQQVFENIYAACKVNCNIDYDSSKKLERSLFPKLSQLSQQEIVFSRINSVLSMDGTAIDSYDRIKNEIPCAWEYALRLIVKANIMEYLSSFNSLGAYCFSARVWIDVYQACRPESRNDVIRKIIEAYEALLSSHALNGCEYILDSIGQNSDDLWRVIYSSVCNKKMIASYSKSISDLFEYLSLAKYKPQNYWDTLSFAINNMPSIEELCVSEYKARSRNDHDYATLLEYARKKSLASTFVEKVQLADFFGLTFQSPKGIMAAYGEYVDRDFLDANLKDKVEQSFIDKIKTHFSSCSDKERIVNGQVLFRDIGNTRWDASRKLQCLIIIENEIFNNQKISVLDKAISRIDFLNDVLDFNEKNNISTNEIVRVLWEIKIINGSAGRKEKNTTFLWNLITEDHLLCLSEKLPSTLRNEIWSEYYDSVVGLMFAIYDFGCCVDFSYLIDGIIRKFSACDGFSKKCVKALHNQSFTVNDHLPQFFDYLFAYNNIFCSQLLEIIEKYLLSLNKKTRKNLFLNLPANVNNPIKMRRYIKQFETKHSSWLSKIIKLFTAK